MMMEREWYVGAYGVPFLLPGRKFNGRMGASNGKRVGMMEGGKGLRVEVGDWRVLLREDWWVEVTAVEKEECGEDMMIRRRGCQV